MKAPTLDELVLLPEPLALQRHYDARSYRAWRWLLLVTTVFHVVFMAQSADNKSTFGAILHGVCLLLGIALFTLRGRDFFTRYFRQILLCWLFIQILALKNASAQVGDAAVFFGAVFFLLTLRLRISEHFLLFLAYWVAAVLPLEWLGVQRTTEATTQEDIIAVSVLTVLNLIGALVFTQLRRRRFLAEWRREHFRQRERLRMREEIEYARKIQLSMLPQGPPDVDWLDLAAASLPATEVGGDYYDYFRLSPSQFAVVLGDVSGHGLASGLLLSGVRSCLYLLDEYLVSPIRVFERLNHMVRRTTDRRTYVTLLCAVFDREQGTLTVTSAGHPPVLRWDAQAGGFTEAGQGAPPLGTFLEAEYVEDRIPVASGDLLVLYTDGLIETRNSHDQEYGEDRLRRTIARASTVRTARELRDAILGDLANFKGDEEQADDITVVAVRLR